MIDEDSVTDDERKVSGQGKKIMSKFSVLADCDFSLQTDREKKKRKTRHKKKEKAYKWGRTVKCK